MEKRKFKSITQGDFALIKELHGLNLTVQQIANITGRGTNTIIYVGQASTLAEYDAIRRTHRSPSSIDKEQKRKWSYLTEGTFDNIIAIDRATGGKLSHYRIGKLVDKSSSTINRALQARSWANYQLLLEEMREQSKARRLEKPDLPETEVEEVVEAVEEVIEPTPVEGGEDLTEGLEDIVNNWRLYSAQLEERLRKLGY